MRSWVLLHRRRRRFRNRWKHRSESMSALCRWSVLSPGPLAWWNTFTAHLIGQEINTYAWSALLAGDANGNQTMNWKFNMMVDLPLAGDKVLRDNILPPAYVMTAAKDILRDERRAYVEHLRSAGRLIEHVEYNTNHGGLFPELSRRGVANGALGKAVQVLSSHLHGN